MKKLIVLLGLSFVFSMSCFAEVPVIGPRTFYNIPPKNKREEQWQSGQGKIYKEKVKPFIAQSEPPDPGPVYIGPRIFSDEIEERHPAPVPTPLSPPPIHSGFVSILTPASFDDIMVSSTKGGLGSKAKYPHLLKGQREGEYVPQLGYTWVNIQDPKDKRVYWHPNLIYRELHLQTTNKPGVFEPEEGYEWNGRQEDLQVLSVGEVAAAVAIVVSVQQLTDRFSKDFDKFLPSKGPMDRQDSRSHEGSGGKSDSRGHSSWGAGTGGGRSTGPSAQDRL